MSESFLIPDSKNFSPDFNEVARYLGYKRTTPPEADVLTLMKKAASEMQGVLKPQAVFEVFDLDCQFEKKDDSKWEIYKITFADVTLHSKDLGANLKNCKKVALMAATIGPQVDALIRKYTSLDSVYASILQATGAMYIEEVVDLVNKEINKIAEAEGFSTRPRYSPGYGDVPLEMQKEFFRLLPCTRIGLTLMDTLIMAPEKSVTAFVGVEDR